MSGTLNMWQIYYLVLHFILAFFYWFKTCTVFFVVFYHRNRHTDTQNLLRLTRKLAKFSSGFFYTRTFFCSSLTSTAIHTSWTCLAYVLYGVVPCFSFRGERLTFNHVVYSCAGMYQCRQNVPQNFFHTFIFRFNLRKERETLEPKRHTMHIFLCVPI